MGRKIVTRSLECVGLVSIVVLLGCVCYLGKDVGLYNDGSYEMYLPDVFGKGCVYDWTVLTGKQQ